MNVATTSFAGPTQLALVFVPGLTDILGPDGPGNLKTAVPDPPPPAPSDLDRPYYCPRFALSLAAVAAPPRAAVPVAAAAALGLVLGLALSNQAKIRLCLSPARALQPGLLSLAWTLCGPGDGVLALPWFLKFSSTISAMIKFNLCLL